MPEQHKHELLTLEDTSSMRLLLVTDFISGLSGLAHPLKLRVDELILVEHKSPAQIIYYI